MKKMRVRFHLGRGAHYFHWQVKTNNSVTYYDPKLYQLELGNCRLVNRPSASQKVFSSGVKNVCGWVECENYWVLNTDRHIPIPVENLERLYYNPIIDPNWKRESDGKYYSWNNCRFASLITDNNKLYILEEKESLV